VLISTAAMVLTSHAGAQTYDFLGAKARKENVTAYAARACVLLGAGLTRSRVSVCA
jgi:hypothetical protein